ncbi:hypothetical protein ID866_4214 [Astraeus odoratus]|nr:hypothetical protein ID866_4214 [Astraeus odoratus]
MWPTAVSLATASPARSSLVGVTRWQAQSRWTPWKTSVAHHALRNYALSRFPEKRIGFGRSSAATRKSQKESDPSKQGDRDGLPLDSSGMRQPMCHPDAEGGLKQLLANDTLIVTRQLEMLNIFVGFEQSNRYVVANTVGEPLGYIVEEPRGVLSMFARQLFRTHRPFRALVMDLQGSPILWIRRPFAWINSRMFVQRPNDAGTYTQDGEPVLDTVAEVQQEWHLWRRKYNLFLKVPPIRILSPVSEPQAGQDALEPHFKQFARVDEGLWAWDFVVRNSSGEGIASIRRAFRGIGREFFTDTGQYVVTFSSQEESVLSPSSTESMQRPNKSNAGVLAFEERAVSCSGYCGPVNIDYDYFSRHSEG